jgi:sugar lactone lactonase YvrE
VDGSGTAARFYGPGGIAVDDAGNVYVVDTQNDTVRRITQAGVVTTLAGSPGQAGSADGVGSAARFGISNSVSTGMFSGLAVDRSGNLYLADTGNDTVRKISPSVVNESTVWTVTTLAGTAGMPGSVDGTGAAAQFSSPAGIAVDGAGNVYVADTQNNTIRVIAPNGAVTTLAGSVGQFGNSDGRGRAALFSFPYGVAADGAGNVYVADSNADIRKLTPAGITTTLAGTAGVTGSTDGVGAAAQFSYPIGIAVDGSGGIYVADYLNATIRKGSLAIGTQPASQTVNMGSVAVLTLAVPGTGPYGYQWQWNGVDLTDGNGISGSNGPQLVIGGVGSGNNGSYDCIVTSEGASVQSGTADIAVATVSNPGSLVNISCRAFVGTGDNILIGGFYIVGSSSRTVLIQALGPSLAEEGVTGVLQQPVLTVFDTNGNPVYSNAGWGSSQILLNAATTVYASPVLQPNSTDSEALLTLPPGGYTAEVSGADGGTGVALCAIYQLP